MNVLLFGASGMVGQGVLRECLLDPDVPRVRSVGRTPTGIEHPKLRETIHRDLWHYAGIEAIFPASMPVSSCWASLPQV